MIRIYRILRRLSTQIATCCGNASNRICGCSVGDGQHWGSAHRNIGFVYTCPEVWLWATDFDAEEVMI